MNSLNPSPSGRRQKNGSVELLRFLFTSVIIFFHINLDLWDQQKVIGLVGGAPVTFFKHGNIAVEFFFLVTGWLMAASVYRKIRGAGGSSEASPAGAGIRIRQKATIWTRALESLRDTLGETAHFVGHKARAILPYYLTACALTPLMRLVTDRSLTPVYFLKRLPSLLFLERLGLGKAFIGCTWYLSSMMLALCLAYPLCRRFYRFYTCFAGPVLGCLLLWAMVAQTGSLGDIGDWFYITYKTNVRAFAEISIGAASFECSRLLSAGFSGRSSAGAGRDASQESRGSSGARRSISQLALSSSAGRRAQESAGSSGARRSISQLALSSSAGRRAQENTGSSGSQSVREGFPVTFCRALLSLAAVTGLALSVAYMCSAMDGVWALAVIGLLFGAVTIVFSGEGLLCHAGLFRHPLFLYLGSISLPMYVSQTLLRRMVPFYFPKVSQWSQCLMIYTGIILFAVLLHMVIPVVTRIPALVRSRTGLRRRLHRPAFFRQRP